MLSVAILLLTAQGFSEAGYYHFCLQNGTAGVNGIPFTGAEETHLREAYPNAAPGNFINLSVGWEWFAQGGRTRSLIRFNPSYLKESWTDSTNLISSKLSLYCNSLQGERRDRATIYLHRILPADSVWNGGTLTSSITAQVGASCLNSCIFDSTPEASQARPWAGSVGCGTAGVDYDSVPLDSVV